MPLQPPKRPPDDEQRLVVLYALQQLAPCTELQLLQFLSEYDWMNYFDMMFALQELCARGQAVRSRKRAGYLYQPTDAGQEALVLFGGRVPGSVKKTLEETGDQWRRRFAQEDQYQHSIHQTDRGEYELTLTVVEQEMDMLRLSLTVPTRELAQQLASQWPQKASQIYETVIHALTEEEP
ncbi:MAG: DUF4364 family protein [Clostridia bacterium]|nr:DUF4364 family protein [Clostridia bacterium]